MFGLVSILAGGVIPLKRKEGVDIRLVTGREARYVLDRFPVDGNPGREPLLL